jgi:bifunctional non-homologous end joining protein LigD
MSKPAGPLIFVVQEHHATRLHWDFRLELDGALKSWAVPKGPPEEPGIKRLAQQVEDHPLEYATFAGSIPAGDYGAGTVKIWDHGTWEPQGDTPAQEQLAAGDLKIILHGKKLKGGYALVRFKKAGENSWLLIKEKAR